MPEPTSTHQATAATAISRTFKPAPPLAIDPLTLGTVTCDFMRPDTFQNLVKIWLTDPQEKRLHHIVTLNPEMVMAAEVNTSFRAAVNAADIRVPDGAGLIWAQWYIRSQFWSFIPSLLAFSFRQVERITGVATVKLLAKQAAEYQQSVYLLGGTPAQVSRTAKLLTKRWPGLTVYTSQAHAFDPAGPRDIIQDIQAKQPAILLVAYGAERQIPWIEQHRAQLPSVRIAVGVGGAFAILSEDKPRAPRFLQQLNLEWLWRLLLEPARLPRIWRATVKFPLLIARQKAAHPPTFPEVDGESLSP